MRDLLMHKTTDNGGIVLDDVSGRVTEMEKQTD